MLREFMWKMFENTGNIEPYMFFKEIEEKGKEKEEVNSVEEKNSNI